MEIAVTDFEAVRLANGRSLIHNISVVTGRLDNVKQWRSSGRGSSPVYLNTTIHYDGPRIDIRINNSLKNPAIELSENIQNKLRDTSIIAKRLGFVEVEVPTLRQALRIMLDFIHKNSDGIMMGHSLDRDLEFLFDTAHVLGEKKIFKKDFLFRPEVGCYIGGWDRLTLVCTQRLLTTLCPKFDKAVAQTYTNTRLNSYAGFVFPPGYEQTHTSTGDAYDLYMVLREAYKVDKFKIDIGRTRLFMKPTSLHGRQ